MSLVLSEEKSNKVTRVGMQIIYTVHLIKVSTNNFNMWEKPKFKLAHNKRSLLYWKHTT